MIPLFACLVFSAAPAPAEVVQSFVATHCKSCHSGAKPKGSLSLEKHDAASIAKDRKAWIQVLERTRGGDMPPEKQPRPAPAQVEAFASALESIWDAADRAGPRDPGKVTARRLNRVEYANTVRDLVGVDFNPADDFPADDIGHGFDNIGDVLTLPPVLLERYLTAAEGIAERAIAVTIPPVPRRYLAGRFLHPYPNDLPGTGGRFRPMRPLDPNPIYSGPFAAGTDYLKFSSKDDFFLRVKLYAEPKGKSPVKVVLFLSGPKVKNPSPDAEVDKLMGAGLKAMKPIEILKTFEITARDDKKLQEIEFPINRRDDAQRAGIALLKPPSGEEPPLLFVEHIWSEGPMDTRPKSHAMILAATPGKPVAAQTREVVGRFIARAFRRPVTNEEIERYSEFVDKAVAGGQKWEAGVRIAIQVALVSPHFLFRVERDRQAGGADPKPVSEVSLASRLSYFLWSSMPDETLMTLAGKGQLSANLEAQVRRMLADPKADALIDNFFPQWLQLRRLDSFSPDTTRFPAFNDELRKAMREEATLLFREIVRRDRPATELVTADYTFLNQKLAAFYGIADTAGNPMKVKAAKPGGKPIPANEFVKVDVSGWPRGGVTNMAAVLAVTSNPTRTSPVKRGKWVLEQLLGAPPPPPPPNVPELKEGGEALKGTLKQRMEQHRANPACASCHLKMDALGFAFESFNAIGAWRDKDEDQPVDATGELPGGIKLDGPKAVKDYLAANRDKFMRCLAEKLLTYATGRGLEPYDRRAVDAILKRSGAKGDKFSELVLAIVESDPFRMKRGREPDENGR